MRTRRLILTMLMALAVVSAALAKEEAFLEPADEDWGGFEEAQEIRNPISHSAYYGWLNDEEDVDTFMYRLDVASPYFLVAISVPECGDHFEAFYPTIAVVGEGLKTPDDVDLPFDLPQGMGAIIISESRLEGTRRVSRYQPYNFYESGIRSYPLEAGDYIIAVWDTDASAGPYVLRIYNQHPEFADYTIEDWEALDTTYHAINNHGWVTDECEQVTVSAATS